MNAADAQTGTGNARVHSFSRRMHLQTEPAKLDAAIAAYLKKLGYGG